MKEYLIINAEYLLRIFFAAIVGGIIGYERKNRGKGAGIRTHIIVAVASALMMIVSKYGFNDLAFGEDFRLDPSRIASQIVSGVGFIGAGMIFVKKQTVQGLTTAAGVWATSGIGMAIGSGMYIIGVSTSVIIVFVQFITHKKWGIFKSNTEEQFEFFLKNNDDSLFYLKKYLDDAGAVVSDMSLKIDKDNLIKVKISAFMPEDFERIKFLEFDKEKILSFDI